jgi:protein-S-isoprenylcysteine O-methyltransferase Ste14
MTPKLSSTVGLLIAILATVTLVFQESIFAVGFVAILVQVFAALNMLWARLTFGGRSFHATADPTEGGLVTSGPYRFLRHPIYAAVLYFLWAGILSHISLINVLLGVGATIGLFMRIFAEERLVTERYPEYAAYASRTKRIIPFIL